MDAVTIAAPPTAASGDAASTVIVSVRLASEPEIEGSAGAEPGDVVLPPQAGIAAPKARIDTA